MKKNKYEIPRSNPDNSKAMLIQNDLEQNSLELKNLSPNPKIRQNVGRNQGTAVNTLITNNSDTDGFTNINTLQSAQSDQKLIRIKSPQRTLVKKVKKKNKELDYKKILSPALVRGRRGTHLNASPLQKPNLIQNTL